MDKASLVAIVKVVCGRPSSACFGFGDSDTLARRDMDALADINGNLGLVSVGQAQSKQS